MSALGNQIAQGLMNSLFVGTPKLKAAGVDAQGNLIDAQGNPVDSLYQQPNLIARNFTTLGSEIAEKNRAMQALPIEMQQQAIARQKGQFASDTLKFGNLDTAIQSQFPKGAGQWSAETGGVPTGTPTQFTAEQIAAGARGAMSANDRTRALTAAAGGAPEALGKGDVQNAQLGYGRSLLGNALFPQEAASAKARSNTDLYRATGTEPLQAANERYGAEALWNRMPYQSEADMNKAKVDALLSQGALESAPIQAGSMPNEAAMNAYSATHGQGFMGRGIVANNGKVGIGPVLNPMSEFMGGGAAATTKGGLPIVSGLPPAPSSQWTAPILQSPNQVDNRVQNTSSLGWRPSEPAPSNLEPLGPDTWYEPNTKQSYLMKPDGTVVPIETPKTEAPKIKQLETKRKLVADIEKDKNAQEGAIPDSVKSFGRALISQLLPKGGINYPLAQ